MFWFTQCYELSQNTKVFSKMRGLLVINTQDVILSSSLAYVPIVQIWFFSKGLSNYKTKYHSN